LQGEQSIVSSPWQYLQSQNLYPLELRQLRPLHRPMIVGFGGCRIMISACCMRQGVKFNLMSRGLQPTKLGRVCVSRHYGQSRG
jgi:hypothetical protein